MRSHLKRQMILHLKNGGYPRDLGFPWRKQAENEDEFFKILEWFIYRKNSYAAINSQYFIDNDYWDTIYIDLDSNSLRLAWEDMRKVVQACVLKWDYEPRVYFSGSKGFAIYLDFPTVQVNKETIREFTMSFLNECGVTTEDAMVLGDKRRISRIPFTLNFNNLKKGKDPMLCIPIDPIWKLEHILKEARNCTMRKLVDVGSCQQVSNLLMELDVSVAKEKEERKKIAIKSISELDKDLYSDKLNTLMKGATQFSDKRNRALTFLLIPTAIEAGHTAEQAFWYCEQWVVASGADFSEYKEYCETVIQRTIRNGWRSWNIEDFILNHYQGGMFKFMEDA
jgi:hypothetical protein